MDGLKVPRARIKELADDASLDLIAAFSALEAEVNALVEQAAKEKWAVAELMKRVDALLEPERGGPDGA